MPLEQLLDAMRADAADEVARLHADSEAEAERIEAGARERAAELERRPGRAAEQAAAARAAERLALARLDAAGCLRQARADGFEEVLEAVRSRLSNLREDDGYREVLSALIRESRDALPEGRRLRVHRDDAAVAAELAGPDVDVEPCLEGWGGIELDAGDGRLLRNTLEERLDCASSSLRRRFAELLDEWDAGP